VWHAQFLVHGAHYTQKKFLGWQATENLDEFSLLLQKWAAESPLGRGLSALDEGRRDAGTINVFPAAPSPMKVTLIPVTPFQQNSSLLVCEATGRAAVVDPGGDLDVIQG